MLARLNKIQIQEPSIQSWRGRFSLLQLGQVPSWPYGHRPSRYSGSQLQCKIAEVSPPPQETLTTLTPLIPLMLRSISALEASKLTMISAEVADVLPRILKSYGKVTISDVSVTVNLLCNAVRPELYRLRLQETYRVLHGSLTIQASVAESIEPTAAADFAEDRPPIFANKVEIRICFSSKLTAQWSGSGCMVFSFGKF